MRTKDEDLYMKFEPDKLEWTRSPKSYKIAEDRIEIVTAPNTDLWQRTYYAFASLSDKTLT